MIALLLACSTPASVTMSGVVYDGMGEGASPVAGASLCALDLSRVPTDRGTTRDDGSFDLQVPYGGVFFLELGAPGSVTTAFSGVAAPADFDAPDGAIWLRSDDDMAELRQVFDGCPGAGGEGAVIEGEVLLGVQSGGSWQAASVETAWVTAYDSGGDAVQACYLDDDGAYDPSATTTGFSARFAIFDAPTGTVDIAWGYHVTSDLDWSTQAFIDVPPGGVAPLYPLWVDLVR